MPAARTPISWPTGCPGCAGRGWRCGCRSAATRRFWPRPCTATPRRRCNSTSSSGLATSRPDPLRCRTFRSRSGWPMRRCGSNVDISHVQGTDVVASLVVFEDGLPRKSDYRHFAIREAAGEGRSDDVASIAEVTRRRFRGTCTTSGRTPMNWPDPHVAGPAAPDPHVAGGGSRSGGRSRRFAYPPNLLRRRRWCPTGQRGPGRARRARVDDVAVIGLAKAAGGGPRNRPADPAAQ